jgi:hypothetical protein
LKWIPGIKGIFWIWRHRLLLIVNGRVFGELVNLIVLANTIILASDGSLPESSQKTLSDLNLVFISIFTFEMGLKMMAMGIVDYLRDKMNIIDAIIVILSLVEIFILGTAGNTFTAFRGVRIFRAFRVLRMTKLMRSLQFLGFIIKVINSALQSFSYILLLTFLFIFIFSLLGMQFFGGQLRNNIQPIRENYDNFQSSFLVTFQILTLENWNNVLYSLLLSPVNSAITIIYLVLWIFIGNYVFLNLFLAILLDKFEEQWRLDKDNLRDKRYYLLSLNILA